MKLADLPGYLRDTGLRFLPHRARTGLMRIGSPGPDSPVLITGNFTLTVRRLREALTGHDAWLIVANSKGFNVWCAAGGGHLTHHDIISAIRTTRLSNHVEHHEVILPQLSATGVERRAITEATGFTTRWGPARLEDLPAFLDRGSRVVNSERFMRFPLWERMEMAAMWCAPALVLLVPALAFAFGLVTGVFAGAALVLMVGGIFALLPWFRIGGTARRLVTLAGFASVSVFACCLLLLGFGTATPAHVAAVAASGLLGAGMLFADLPGTTPSYPSAINTFGKMAQVELNEARCNGSAECVQVCPRDVLKMNGRRRKVEIQNPDQCIQCGACVVQCPEDALMFRYSDGSTVEAPTIRNTRMNMLGRRRAI
jgi:NAD-dependent dihydropyrimidine dehydrogenase PreA subunit